ncbi:M23 family metallopeptidase [Nocardioides sambongensis]|uniref:M23 family metallopeptidase n=1 Tax=Nocardioides sambongensis TaxID=2589074 RepID=UPI00112DA9AC|nr:M23 family metallopeptidase [Nocardioides sambongensis]
MSAHRSTLRRSLFVAATAGLALGCVGAAPSAGARAAEATATTGDDTMVLAATGVRAAGALVVRRPTRTVVRRTPLAPVTAVLPVRGYRLTGTFGSAGANWSSTHTGLDFAAPYGTAVSSVVDGTVVSVGYDGAFGLKVVVRADDGSIWWYCHLSATTVDAGASVTAGRPVGAIGLTGNTTGPHLHLEVHRGDPVDPYAELVDRGLTP